ncbi:MAG TPA: hypothetical protein VKB69_14515 [Micromonosporaceae bacterium]|nr:hypothetical protein [Micromonosporaceae bacterium]
MTGDIGAFLSRLVRLDPAGLVRLRVAGQWCAVWGRVPWNVLVSRTVAASDVGVADADDVTVRAADWLAAGAGEVVGLERLDARWRTPLPGGRVRTLETLPSSELRRLGEAAARTLRETEAGGVGGRAVGARALRDALLDHVAIVVTVNDGPDDGAPGIDIPQRLVQAVARMGFLGTGDEPTRVIQSGRWIGLAAPFGVAWWRRPGELSVIPVPAARG